MFSKWININVCHFLIHLIKITDYKLYPPIPSSPPVVPPQVGYHLNVVQANRQGLTSGIRVATGLSSVVTLVTFIRIPVSAALGAASMTEAIASGIISALTKKYQQKLKKITRLTDIITPALVVFERVVSGALKDSIIDEEELNMLQTLYLETLNELTGVDRRMEVEHRSLVEKSLLEEINELKKIQEQVFNCLLAVLSCVLL